MATEDCIPMGLRFSLLHRAFRRKLDEHLREMELTGVQFGVLGELARLEAGGGAINHRALATASHVTHPTMTEILKRLEQKGFIECRPSQADRRNKCIVSTDKARSLHREIDRLDEAVFQWLCTGLSAEQVEQLTAITDTMLENIFAQFKKGCDKHCG